MSAPEIVAAIPAIGVVLVPIVALLLNYRGFTSIEDRLKVIEADLKQFYKMHADHDKEIALLKERNK